MKNYIFIFLALLTTFLLLLEFLIGSFTGDRDGEITNYGLHDILFWSWFISLCFLTVFYTFKKNLIAINVSIFVCLWFLVELGAFFIYQYKTGNTNTVSKTSSRLEMTDLKADIPKNSNHNYTFLVKNDVNLGYKLLPNGKVRGAMYLQTTPADTIYSVIYQTDSISRRVTSVKPYEKREFYALFFGCSYTFGEGLADTVCFNTRLEKNPKIHTYNYGLGGYGTQHVLALWQDRNIRKEVLEEKGLGIYLFLDDHVVRTVCPLGYNWLLGAPWYELEDEQVIRKGQIHDRKQGFRVWYAQNSYLAKLVGYEPYTVTEESHKLVAQMIETTFVQYQNQFANDNFFVLIYPNQEAKFRKYLKNEKIKILDYSKLWDSKEHKNYILKPQYEGHPNARATQKIADTLKIDLAKYFE